MGNGLLMQSLLLPLLFLCGAGAHDWNSLGPATASTPVSLRLALKQRNLDKLEAAFWAISDPKSKMYGKYMTQTEVGALIAPSPADMTRISTWVSSVLCITHHSIAPTQDYLFLHMPAHCASQTFTTQMHLFASNSTTTTNTRTRTIVRAAESQEVAIPAALQDIVEGIHGLTDFPPVKARLSSVKGGSGYPGDSMTPLNIAKAYGLEGVKGKGKASLAVAEFEQEYFFPDDIQAFLKNYSLPTANVTRIVGLDDPLDGDLGEASLDIQYAMGLAPGIEAWAWELDAFDLTAWALNVSNTKGSPKVHSISYGSKESAFSLADMTRDNTEFQKLGVQGFTILVASGDNGTGKDGLFRCKRFMPNFPATSPYITSVGGTYIVGSNESAIDFSGGGFSTSFPMPAYQKDKVAAYLKAAGSSLPDSKMFNATNRAIPDIAAVGTNFNVLIQGFWSGPIICGTSASAPVWAAIVALLNDARSDMGKGPLGFLNPALYAMDTVGRDITTGSANKAGGIGGCKQGFSPTPGWDPVTGLGSPVWADLLKSMANSLP